MKAKLLLVFLLMLFLEGICQSPPPKTKKKYVAEAEAGLQAFGRNPEIISDLDFLKPILEGKRIVYLGESNHHSETYNELKLKFIRFLHLEMGFNVVAFESNISSCLHADLVKQEISPFYLLTHSILGCWRTESNIELMDFIKRSGMNIAGFDPNLNSAILDKDYYPSYFQGSSQSANRLYALDSLLQAYEIQRSNYLFSASSDASVENKPDSVRDSLRSAYSAFAQEISSSGLPSSDQKRQKILEITLKNKIALLSTSSRRGLNREEQFITNAQREQWMENNLEFIIDSLYPDEKIIVWAHNAHISKGGKSTYLGFGNKELNNTLGFRLHEKYGWQSYTIGLYGYPGNVGTGYSTTTTQLDIPVRNSLESLLFHTQKDLFFLETDVKAFQKPMYNYSESNFAVRSIISDCYDAVIFARNIEPAVLIRYDQIDDYE